MILMLLHCTFIEKTGKNFTQVNAIQTVLDIYVQIDCLTRSKLFISLLATEGFLAFHFGRSQITGGKKSFVHIHAKTVTYEKMTDTNNQV